MRATILHVRPADRRCARPFVWPLVLAGLLLSAEGVRAQTAPRPVEDAFADGSWHLELAGHGAIEAWNYNNTHEKLYAWSAGLTYGLRNGLALTLRAPLYYVDQRGTDAFLLGVSGGVRGRIYGRQRLAIFVEVDLGVSDADVVVPPRGTRFNYLAMGSAGATFRVRRAVHVVASMRWLHVSNGGVAGRDRNPDIEAIGPQVGILMGF
jgi:hypothetical protein